MVHELANAIMDLNEEEALRIVEEQLAYADPYEILKSCKEGIEQVGKKFEEGEYFVSHLIISGEILKRIFEMVNPKIKKTESITPLGNILIGTVEGDIHDIGKNIVSFMLSINGFEVHDIGVDVSPEKIVAEIKKIKPGILGLSGLLTSDIEPMKRTIEAVKKSGVGRDVKIIIGGSQMDERVMNYVGADAYAADAMKAVSLCKKLVNA